MPRTDEGEPRFAEAVDALDGVRYVEPALAGGRKGLATAGSFLNIPPVPPRLGRFFCRGQVAQLVEHTTENRGVDGSIPSLAMLDAQGLGEKKARGP